MTSNQLRNRVEQLKGKKQQIESNIDSLHQSVKEGKRNLHRHEKAREIIRLVGITTQRKLQYHISDITSLALEAVYDDPYQLIAEFVQRRNKTECDLNFVRNDEKVDPMDASGGGAVNVASFALRVASWSMQRPRSNNVILLDEPFNNLDKERMPRAGEMIKQLSEKLGIQFLIVTHSDELAESADKTFRVSINKGVSKVEEE